MLSDLSNCNSGPKSYPRKVRGTSSKRIFYILVAALPLLLIAVALPFASTAVKADHATPPPTPAAERPTLDPIFAVQAGLDGEIFPVFANFGSLQRSRERRLSAVSVNVTNPGTDPLRARIAVQVPGWSDQEIQITDVPSGAARSYVFSPSFLPRLYSNREITAATASVNITDLSGHMLYAGTVPVRLRAVEDMYWGHDFKYAPFIASWVTPHDPMIEQILSRAKEKMPGRRLPGYEPWKNTAAQVHSTFLQAKAIYEALQEQGVSYVKSSTTFGGHESVSERVRMPRESLGQSSANCIDGAVMYASLFENLGMDPVVVLVPGHAYIGVREALNSQDYLYIETSLTGRTSFESAVLAASHSLARVKPADVLRVSISQARRDGIFPMPAPATRERQSASLAADAASPATTASSR